LELPYKTRYGRRDRREQKARKKMKTVLDFLEDKRTYWNLKEESLDRTVWRTHFEIVYGSVAEQTTS
jgi:hypothetical protein